ncbi:MAG: type II secretion system protein GspN [Kofleriaceae bacterium]
MARVTIPRLPQIGPRTKKVLKVVAYIVLALVTFVFALQLTFPYNRVKDKVIEALSSKYDVTISSVERGIMPGKLTFNAVTLRTRPAKADEVATTFFIKKLEISAGIFALIGGTASVDIDAEIGPGRIRGTVAISKTSTAIDIEGSDLPSAILPMRELMGLPMSGKIAFGVNLTLPNEKSKSSTKMLPNWQKAKGAFSFNCANNCTFGDGKTKLRPKLKNSRSQAFAADGIDFGKVNVTSMMAHVTIKDGILELDKFDAKSEDGELHVDFQVTLAPQLDDGMVAGCLRFKGSDILLKKEPRTHAALSTTGANLGPDGLFHIRLDGKFKEMKRLAQTCGPALKGGNMDDPANPSNNNTGNSRPTITVQPTDTPAAGSANMKNLPSAQINPPPPTVPVADAATADNSPQPPGPVIEQNGSGSAQPEGLVQPIPPGEPLPPGPDPASENANP